MSDPTINQQIATVNFMTQAKGLHSGLSRMATVTLVSQDGKFSLQIDPKQFEWIGNNDIILVSLTLVKTVSVVAEKSSLLLPPAVN